MRYGFSPEAKVCVAGIGRCGSTLMTKFLIKKLGDEVVFDVHARDFVEFKGKVIFMFGNPYNSVVSAHTRIKKLKLHYEHMNGDYSRMSMWPLEDTLCLERVFDDWYHPHQFEMISVRYETMWNHLDEIGNFLDVDFSNFPIKLPRKTDWHSHRESANIEKTYKRLKSKIDSAEDIKIWK